MMKKIKISWKGYHRWVGLVLSVCLLVFCVSGVLLNHREALSGCDVSRWWLPADYHIKDYNNGIIRGTLAAKQGVVAYGCAGVFLTDNGFSAFKDYNDGLPAGADRRNIRRVITDPDGVLWCAANYGIYRHDGHKWREVNLPRGGERMTDLSLSPDSSAIVALSRSAVYLIPVDNPAEIKRVELRPIKGRKDSYSLFKTVWMLHSGELFGLPGRLVVDMLAVVMAVLCVTALLIFFLPPSMRRAARKANRERVKRLGAYFKSNYKLHDKLGVWLLVPLLIVVVTGTFLRPPLMVPLVMAETPAVPGSALDNDNPWHDKLRAVRWDDGNRRWLLSTSLGFVAVDEEWMGEPELIADAPPVSPMGVNVFERLSDGEWLIGSFSGAYRWNPAAGTVIDHFTGAPYRGESGRPLSNHLVSGFTSDYEGKRVPVIIFYDKGCGILPAMPPLLRDQPMSLWNLALELHVGRCYTPFLGPLSVLFVFVAGTLIALVLVSGYILHRRHRRR